MGLRLRPGVGSLVGNVVVVGYYTISLELAVTRLRCICGLTTAPITCGVPHRPREVLEAFFGVVR